MSPPQLAEVHLNQFLAILAHLGWGLQRTAKPQPFPGKRRDILAKAAWIALPLPDGQTLVALAVEETLPDLTGSFKNYEDIAILHRSIFRAFDEHHLSARYLLLLDKNGGQLVDIAEEDVLLAVATREEMNDRLLPLLDMQSLTRGSLVAFPRKSIRQRAREMFDWTNVWSARIGANLDLTHSAMYRFFDWVHLARIAELNQIGPILPTSFSDCSTNSGANTARRFLEERFRPLHDQWHLLQENCLKAHLEIAAEASRQNVMGDCLASHCLLSRGKFTAQVLAEAFADEELRLRSWRSSLVYDLPGGPEGDDAQAASGHDGDARWLTSQFTLNLDEAGYIVMLRVFDRLVEIVRRVALDRQSALERGERPGLQLDLLSGAPPEIAPHEAVRHVLKNVLRVQTRDAARLGLVRTVLLARACEWQKEFRVRDMPFPRPNVEIIDRRDAEQVAEPVANYN